jgi:hypothetical protein
MTNRFAGTAMPCPYVFLSMAIQIIGQIQYLQDILIIDKSVGAWHCRALREIFSTVQNLFVISHKKISIIQM